MAYYYNCCKTSPSKLFWLFSIEFRVGREELRGLALNFVSTHQTENPRGFSEVGENKPLLIGLVADEDYSIL